jgi:tripartite-type tricarboxylate transporter receptor subunit TctC
MMMIRLCTILITAAVSLASPTQAQPWPNKPIHVIVPFAAGGSTDVAARLVGQHLSKAFGQQVVIENRTGANGNIGTEAAAKAAPDGYTLLIAPDSVAANPHVYKVEYDALKDFIPVVQLSVQPIVLAAHPNLGAKNVAELIALAKKQPGLRFATGSGVGSAQHMATAWFAQLAGIDLTQVPYRGGGQAINDLIAGHITLGTLGSTPLIPHYKAGKLLLLAQTTAARSKSLPDVPTFQEAGIKGLVMDQWLGVFVPAGTPPDIVRKLNTEINLALRDKGLLENFDKSALDVVGGSSDQFAGRVREDFSKYEKIVKDLKIKAQ